MTFWIVASSAASVLFGLAWCSSGRAKPDLRRRSTSTEVAKREGSAGSFDVRGDGGPAPGGGF